jgi:predicted nucleic acid-binding Zn ribbon protein
MSVLPSPGTGTPGRAGVIDRCCYRCDGEFPTGSRQVRVYCPACVGSYGFPAPAEPVNPPRRSVAATSRRRSERLEVTVPARRHCQVCGVRVIAGQSSCGSCADQLPLFSAKVDRRRKEWRDEG